MTHYKIVVRFVEGLKMFAVYPIYEGEVRTDMCQGYLTGPIDAERFITLVLNGFPVK